MGDREMNLQKALAELAPEVTVVKLSTLHETEPMYNTDQPKFLNAVCEATTELSALEVLKKLKSIEKEMGEHEHNQPRIIDIDLLFYDNEIIETSELTIPHPKIAERRFVLEPMAELASEFVHPVLGVTIAELLRKL